MYNRYVPQNDGSYRKNRSADNPPRKQPPPLQSCNPVTVEQPHCQTQHQPTGILDFFKGLLPRQLDTGDLLIILLLLLMAGDGKENDHTPLLTLVLYLLM